MNSFAKLLNQFFDNRMEDFETAFPAVIDSLNDDGSVNVRPSVRNCLRNMQMEPEASNGKLHVIRDVPVLFCGTKAVYIDYELSAGDTVLCISSSRDIRNWKKETWGEKASLPLSFSGNDLINLIAIPVRKAADEPKVRIHVDRAGEVSVECATFLVDGDMKVTGAIEADGEISTNVNPLGKLTLSGHKHKTGVGPTTPADPTLG